MTDVAQNGADEQLEDGESTAASFYDQPRPRVNLRKDTLALLKSTGVPDTHSEVVTFCNNAVQLTVRRGHGHLADLNDALALSVALDCRAKELGAIMLDLSVVMNDLVFLAEFGAVLGAFREELRKELKK